MTAGLPAGQLPPGGDWIARELKAIRRELEQLRASRRLESAQIGAGGLTVTDGGGITIGDGGTIDLVDGTVRVLNGSGQVVAQLGLLPGGGYGVAAVNPANGQLVSLSTLAFGLRSVTANGIGTRNNTGYGALSGLAGPVVPDVPIGPSGRALVILTAQVTVTDNTGRSGFMSVAVSGATTINPNDGWAHKVDIGGTTGGQNMSPDNSRLHLFDGVLNEGLNTFTARYRTITATGNVTWSGPNITVLPY